MRFCTQRRENDEMLDDEFDSNAPNIRKCKILQTVPLISPEMLDAVFDREQKPSNMIFFRFFSFS